MTYVPFVIFFIMAIILFTYKSTKATRMLTKTKEDFLERERSANFTPKEIINDELYIKPNIDKLPFHIYEIDNIIDNIKLMRINQLQEKIQECGKSPMFKLSAEISNTTLKETYGRSNLDILINGEQNYNNYIKYLNNWAEALIEMRNYDHAKIILEEALEKESDTSLTYILLITTYYATDKIKLRSFIKSINNRVDYPVSNIVYNKIIKHYEKLKSGKI